MKFILTADSWEISELDPIEWTFLNRIPEMATGADLPEDYRRRLYPDPIDVPAGEREAHEGFLEDWDEFVRPDLEMAFQGARNQVASDLAGADTEDAVDDEDGATYAGVPARVRVARAASDDWYNALNQARLLMNEAYDLAEAGERYHWAESDAEGAPAPPIDGTRLVLLAQYEFYTALQSILIEVMMRNDREARGDHEEPDEL